jgi:hypothetical protein
VNPGDVLQDFNRRSAIVMSVGRKLTHLVMLEEGPVILRALSEEELIDGRWRVIAYPTKRAARKFLAHSGGVSDKAREALNLFKKGE